MATKRNAAQVKKYTSDRDLYVRSQVRFSDQDELDLIKRAVAASGAKSMNAWIVDVLLRAAREALRSPSRGHF